MEYTLIQKYFLKSNQQKKTKCSLILNTVLMYY